MIKTTAIGRLTKEPTFTQTTSGIDMTRFTLACKSKLKDEKGEYKTNFLNCVAWRGLAQTIMQNCHKADMVSVSGSFDSRYYGEADERKLVWDLTVDDIEYLTPKAERESSNQPAKESNEQQKFEPVDDDNLPF